MGNTILPPYPVEMCIVLLSSAHPDYPFILLSNRDEFLNRPTASVHWWDFPNEHVLGGRDLQRKERGTWLAITKQGRIAALTNFREEGDTYVAKDKSRGAMVNAYLTSPPHEREASQAFAKRLINDVGVNDVGGFSLVFGELRAQQADGSRHGLSILSNRSASADDLVSILSKPGETHGLSNSHFGDTSWPKVVHGEKLLKQAIDNSVMQKSNEDNFIDDLFNILSLDTLPKRKTGEDWDTYVRQMRNSILIPPVGGTSVNTKSASEVATGISKVAQTSSGYDTPDHPPTNGQVKVGEESYGTQKQTVILVSKEGKVVFVERTLYDPKGMRLEGKDGEKWVEFEIEGWEG